MALAFQIDGAANFFVPQTPARAQVYTANAFVKVVDAIFPKINGAFATCAPLFKKIF